MARALGTAGLVVATALALALGTACAPGYYVRRESAWSTGSTAWVAGGGTISSTRTVGPYGPVSGVSVGPGYVSVYDGYAPGYGYGPGYGYAPGYAAGGYAPGYGSAGYPGYGYGPGGASPYGYAPYGGYGTYTTCTGAVACGAGGSTTGYGYGYGAPPPAYTTPGTGGTAVIIVTP